MNEQRAKRWERRRSSGKARFQALNAALATSAYLAGNVLMSLQRGQPTDWPLALSIGLLFGLLVFITSDATWKRNEAAYGRYLRERGGGSTP